MSSSAIIEKDRMQRERDQYRDLLRVTVQLDGANWRAVRASKTTWDFCEFKHAYRNGRRRRVIADVERGLSDTVLLDKIIGIEKQTGRL